MKPFLWMAMLALGASGCVHGPTLATYRPVTTLEGARVEFTSWRLRGGKVAGEVLWATSDSAFALVDARVMAIARRDVAPSLRVIGESGRPPLPWPSLRSRSRYHNGVVPVQRRAILAAFSQTAPDPFPFR